MIILSCLVTELTQQILRPWFTTLNRVNRASTKEKLKQFDMFANEKEQCLRIQANLCDYVFCSLCELEKSGHEHGESFKIKIILRLLLNFIKI